MTSFVMREIMLSHLVLWGSFYSRIIRSGKNKVVGRYPLLLDGMEVSRNSRGKRTYTYTTSEGEQMDRGRKLWPSEKKKASHF